MYNRALELANQFLGEDVDSVKDNQVKQLKDRKTQLTKQFEDKKEQMTKQFNQQIASIDAQLDRLGVAIVSDNK